MEMSGLTESHPIVTKRVSSFLLIKNDRYCLLVNPPASILGQKPHRYLT